MSGNNKREAEERRELEEDEDYADDEETKPAERYTEKTLRQKKITYNFFNKIDPWWYGSTRITAVPHDRDINNSIAKDYIVRAFLWALLACVLLFTPNLVFKW